MQISTDERGEESQAPRETPQNTRAKLKLLITRGGLINGAIGVAVGLACALAYAYKLCHIHILIAFACIFAFANDRHMLRDKETGEFLKIWSITTALYALCAAIIIYAINNIAPNAVSVNALIHYAIMMLPASNALIPVMLFAMEFIE